MELASDRFRIHVFHDPTYTPNSVDNVVRYDAEYLLGPKGEDYSRLSVRCIDDHDAQTACILLASGGFTAVSNASAVLVEDRCYVAVGDQLCCLKLPRLSKSWAAAADDATCFGVYFSSKHACLVTHGELEIRRYSLNGHLNWRTSGADIFSEGFAIYDDVIEAVDFQHQTYRIAIPDGSSQIIAG